MARKKRYTVAELRKLDGKQVHIKGEITAYWGSGATEPMTTESLNEVVEIYKSGHDELTIERPNGVAIGLAESDGDYVEAAITRTAKPKKFKVPDLEWEVSVLGDGSVQVGCTIIPQKYAERIARHILQRCGYEVDR